MQAHAVSRTTHAMTRERASRTGRGSCIDRAAQIRAGGTQNAHRCVSAKVSRFPDTQTRTCYGREGRWAACTEMLTSETLDQLNLGVWVQTCDMANGKACCVADDQCCNDTSSWFDYKPGDLIAVINGDGSNRLGPYVSADASPSSSLSSPSSSSVSSPSSSTPAPTASSSGEASACANTNSGGRSSSTNKTAIAVGAVLGTALVLACAGLLFFLTRFLREKREKKLAMAELPADFQQQQQPAQEQVAAQAHLPKAYEEPAYNQWPHGQYNYGALNELPNGRPVPGTELSATETAVSELPSGDRQWTSGASADAGTSSGLVSTGL